VCPNQGGRGLELLCYVFSHFEVVIESEHSKWKGMSKGLHVLIAALWLAGFLICGFHIGLSGLDSRAES
jgi:energy-converting hydrogenase Eha subunit G